MSEQQSVTAACSFCLEPSTEVARLVAGPGVYICSDCVELCALLIAGDADLWQPPTMTRMLARHIRNSEFVVVPEAGHSIYWERPDIFNSAVLDFIDRHSN